MSLRKVKQKIWRDNRARRILKKSSKKRMSRRVRKQRYTRGKKPFIATAPENFSLLMNPEDTIAYFNDVVSEIHKKRYGENFYFNLAKVKHLTPEAIMFVLAILKNVKCKSLYKYRFEGNAPIEKSAGQLMGETGFYDYVNSYQKTLEVSNKKVKITSGSSTDPDTARQVCDFINSLCRTDRISTQNIYKTLIELMENTIHHAYDNGKIFSANSWYVFAESLESSVRIIFLDTGAGIPNTVRKKFREYFPLFRKDSHLMQSTFKGDFRTETGEKNRGKGLPGIYNLCKDRVFLSMHVFSGSGCFTINQEQEKIEEYSNELFGTLFVMEVEKDTLKGELRNDN